MQPWRACRGREGGELKERGKGRGKENVKGRHGQEVGDGRR